MADDLRTPPNLPINSSEHPPSTLIYSALLLGFAAGASITPMILAYHMGKAKQRAVDLATHQPRYGQRRPPIWTASVSFSTTVKQRKNEEERNAG